MKYETTENGYSVSAGKYYKDATVELPHTINGKPLTVISAGAFKDNKYVETVVIPSSVTAIEAEAFSGCTNLKAIVFRSKIRAEVITLSASPISGSITTESGVISIGDRAFYGCESLSSIDISSVLTIGENAFEGCKSLKELMLSDHLTTVKSGAFSACSSLKSVYLPAAVEYLGQAVFSGCTALDSVIFEEREGRIDSFDAAWREGMSDQTKVDIGFRLTLNYGKATGNIGAEMIAVLRDDVYALPVPTRQGYAFLGWFTAIADGEQLTDPDGKSVGIYDRNEAIIVYAVWEANANTVHFHSNGGTGTMSEQIIRTDEIAKLSANAFIKPGYTFVGWAAAPDGKKVYNDMQSIEMGVESFSLYALWKAKINTVYFDANGGVGASTMQDIATDETMALLKNTYTRKGYTFIGWAIEPDESVVYTDQASYTMGTEESYTLYAVWSLQEYRITYMLNNGTVNGNNTVYTILSDTFTLNNPTRAGYTFLGWSGTDIEGMSLSVSIETGSVGNRIYMANWSANTNRIIFDANGGEGTMENQLGRTDATVTLNPNQFTYEEGYYFVGWAVTPTGEALFADKDSFLMGIEASYTFYAKWALQKYDISYDLNGGTVDGNPTEYNKLTSTFTLKNPTRPGYTFLGWSGTGIDGISMSVTIETGNIGNRSYTANWRESVNRLVFEANGGEGTMVEQLIDMGTTVTLNANTFTRAGYVFAGWSNLPNGKVVYADEDNYTMGTSESYTLYAIWEVASGGLEFERVGDEYSVSKFWGSITSGDVIIPSMYRGRKVTRINAWVFRDQKNINKVILSKETKTIGAFAFYNSSVTEVVLPEGLITIEESAFSNCEFLETVTIPDSVISIGTYAYNKCKSVSKVFIGSGLSQIGDSAFAECTSLEEVIIPDSVLTMDYGAFAGCTNLKKVKLSDNLTEISEAVFLKCYALESITIPQGVRVIGTSAFERCGISKISLPFSITTIGAKAFSYCGNLKSIFISKNVLSMGNGVFEGCSATIYCEFKEVPNDWHSNWNFSNCTVVWDTEYFTEGLTFTFDSDKTVTVTKYSGTDTVVYIPSVYGGKPVTAISNAFDNCSELKTVIIPISVKHMENGMFSGCTNFEYIQYQGTVAQWGKILKTMGWFKDIIDCVVKCTDGTVEIKKDVPDY